WAEQIVPSEPGDPLPAWETRMWRQIRTRVATRRAARTKAPAVSTTPLPATLASGADAGGDAGEGNAEEWLGATPASLAPVPETPPKPVQRVRLRYRKIGPARFIGMRELGTTFFRAARRAGIALAFSQGHHPLPRLSFGPALPLGFSSDDEYLDLELTEAQDPPAVAARLAAELPRGLEPLDIAEVPVSAPSIDRSVAAFAYEVDLEGLDTPLASEAVAEAVRRFAASAAFPVRKRTRSGERTVDARRVVRGLALKGPTRLALEMAASREETLRPEVFLGELLGLAPQTRALLRVHKVATRFGGAPA